MSPDLNRSGQKGQQNVGEDWETRQAEGAASSLTQKIDSRYSLEQGYITNTRTIAPGFLRILHTDLRACVREIKIY